MNDLIHKIVGIIIEVGQSDTKKFRLGETIRYTPSEILEILKQHESEIFEEASAQPVIRCKDCKYYEIAWLKQDGTDDKRYKPSVCVKGRYAVPQNPDWFCPEAERRANE